MAKGSNNGRIYMMVGLMATIVVPLALVAPGLSRQVTDSAEPQRLGPVYDEEAESGDVRPAIPDQAQPVPSGGDNATRFGQATGFGAPTMDASPNSAVYSDTLPQYEPPAPDATGNASSGQADSAKPVTRSQSEAERTGAIAAGLSVTPTSKTVSYPSGKTRNAPPLTKQAAPKVR